MLARIDRPTPYPDVNVMLDEFVSGVRSILGARLVGMYLGGSLASGDFDPLRSDIDFAAVTDGELPKETIQALEAMHARLAAGGLQWAAKLEGSYITRKALRRHQPAGGPFPCVNEGRFYLARLESHWIIQRHLLRERGIAIAGPAPHTLIDPVRPDDLRRAVLETLQDWWAPMLDDPVRLRDPAYRAFAILTMCRMLYTLRFGAIVSKPVAAGWAQKALDERWAAAIRRAVAWPQDTQANSLNETLAFVRYTLEHRPHSLDLAPDMPA